MYKGKNVGKTYACVDGNATIISYINKNRVLVEFECGTRTTTTITSLIKGKTRNPNKPTLLGIGIIGQGKYSSRNKVIYDAWSNMLKRCYDSNNKYFKSYGGSGVRVCEEWHNFQNFAAWYDSQYKENGWQVDKDLLHYGNKLYSPKGCLMLPRELNMLIQKRAKGECGLSGVTRHGSKYRAQIRSDKWERGSEYLGLFNTAREAHAAYIDKKKCIIKEKAEEWKSKVPQHIYFALIEYSNKLKYDWEE